MNTQIFLGAFLGILGGLVLHWAPPSPLTSLFLSLFDLLGKIFITLLKIVMVPLVFSSIAAGIANLQNSPHSQRAWPALLLYSTTTTCLAGLTGLLAMNLLKPGQGLDIHLFQENMNAFHKPVLAAGDVTHGFFGIVLLSIILGIVLVAARRQTPNLLKAVNSLFELTIIVVGWIMRLAPLGIMGLLAKLVAQQKISLLYVLAKYIAVVMGSTIFHGLITLPLILWLVTGISPRQFFLAMYEAFITAFSTSSSTATLPVSLRCLTQNLKVPMPIARFVLPLGAALNMDGTAMYEAMAALFVANLCGIHLNLISQIIAMLTAMIVSIGAPGIPSAGMVTMIMALQSVGLPAQAVAILIPIDRPLDTVRTVVNVEGDCIGACVVHKATLSRV